MLPARTTRLDIKWKLRDIPLFSLSDGLDDLLHTSADALALGSYGVKTVEHRIPFLTSLKTFLHNFFPARGLAMGVM